MVGDGSLTPKSTSGPLIVELRLPCHGVIEYGIAAKAYRRSYRSITGHTSRERRGYIHVANRHENGNSQGIGREGAGSEGKTVATRAWVSDRRIWRELRRSISIHRATSRDKAWSLRTRRTGWAGGSW